MVREVDGAWRMTCRWSALQGELESSLGKLHPWGGRQVWGVSKDDGIHSRLWLWRSYI